MKKLLSASFILSICCAVALAGCTQTEKGTVVKGHLDGVINGGIIAMVNKFDFSATEWIDTIDVKNGDFVYTLPITDMRNVVLVQKPSDGKKLFEESTDYISLMLLPGTTAKLSGSFSDYHITGNEFYDDMELAQKAIAPILEKFQRDAQALDPNAPDRNRKYMEIIETRERDLSEAIIGFIQENPHSDYGYYLASTLRRGKEQAMALVSEKAKNGPVKDFAQVMEANARKGSESKKAVEAAASKLVPGKPAPDFTLTDIKGNPLSLSSLKGKYVVIDFWGSWCGWCIKGMPKMKEYYKKYNGKLEILGVACGDTEEKWKKAVEEHQIPWLHVINDEKGTNASLLYAVTGYPTKVIIDPQGNLNKTIIGESEEFYEYLDKILK